MTHFNSLQIKFYITESGNEPVRDFLKGLSKDEKKTIGEDLKTVQLGWPLGMPLVRKMEPNLWEVRITLKDKIVRVFFTMHRDVIVLLHCFIKKSNKTPSSDIKLAKKRMLNIIKGK